MTNPKDNKKQIVEEWKNKYLRALADYQNYERRVKEEKEELVRQANRGLILKLLPFLDSLDKAEVFIKDPGLKMIKDSFNKVLKESGVEEMDLTGKPFDPYLSEAVEVVAGDKDNIVLEVVRKGYRYHDKVLRVAQVKVSKKQLTVN
jgi:molecular chaperone GrpE